MWIGTQCSHNIIYLSLDWRIYQFYLSLQRENHTSNSHASRWAKRSSANDTRKHRSSCWIETCLLHFVHASTIFSLSIRYLIIVPNIHPLFVKYSSIITPLQWIFIHCYSIAMNIHPLLLHSMNIHPLLLHWPWIFIHYYSIAMNIHPLLLHHEYSLLHHEYSSIVCLIIR